MAFLLPITTHPYFLLCGFALLLFRESRTDHSATPREIVLFSTRERDYTLQNSERQAIFRKNPSVLADAHFS